MNAASHTADCDWHVDQYDFECRCSAVIGKVTRPSKTVEIDRQLFETLVDRLQRDEQIFNQYGGLHEKKGTRDGHEKAAANYSHANKIRKILMRLTNLQTIPTPLMDAMNDLIEDMASRGEKPAAFMITKGVDKGLVFEERALNPISDHLRYTTVGGQFCGFPVGLIPAAGASGILLLSEASLLYKSAKAGGHVA